MNLFEGTAPIFFDGGMGTMLQSRGIDDVPVTLNLNNPEVIVDIHKSYIASGANIITANTFSANKARYKNFREMIEAGIRLAKRAVNESERMCLVALDLGPTGKFLKPAGELSFEECYDIFKDSAIAGADAGADIIIIETMFDIYEAKAAVLAAKENTQLPVICTMTVDQTGRLITGGDIAVIVSVLEGLGVDAIGINCGLGSSQIKGFMSDLSKFASRPIIIQPNAGLPRMVGEQVFYDLTPESFASDMKEILLSGARILGGCCGTTPGHILKAVEQCGDFERTLNQAASRKGHFACSYSRAVDLSEPLTVGNSINCDIDNGILNSAKEGDIDFFVNAVLDEADNDVDVINLNLGDYTYLAEIISGIQEFTGIPLSIQLEDDSEPTLRNLDRALRVYNGKAMINLGGGLNWAAFESMINRYGGIIISGVSKDKTYRVGEDNYGKKL